MKKKFKNICITIWVICFLIKHKGYFEIWIENLYNKDYQIDLQEDGDCYFYTSIQSLIKDIYLHNYYE